ncbi:MAG: 4Fe-4S dicluster domain-containing protein [Candidatus Eremiobacteraeota bacterium]|nr:4Fe-4S dicluster domain-containing protein [Candidatus Eremiobacteraeota bacterium]MBV8434354.1 4Fe-4S dicluster domain-containing protein [Candidatus Eremiobacteraeota bacterium]MBV8721198.1 4Fe-4S dicluster domain-containing protein [Candidatus Eremiobacteraeota bacterium]
MTVHPGFTGEDQPKASIFNQCIRCGFCLPTCPTYLETMTETSGPRGRIGLVKAVAEERIDLLSPGFVEQMSQCLDCRACEAVCPSGVRYGQLVETARTQIQRARAGSETGMQRAVRGFVLRTLFARLDVMRAAAAMLRFAQQTGLTALAGVAGMGRQAKLAPKIPGAFFVPRGQRVEAKRPAGLAFLHAGCIMQVAFARVHEATMRMLVRSGLSTIVPSDQGCCGAIAIHAGDMALGREFAKRNIVAFERSGADVYVVNAAGCGSALKEYAELFDGDAEWAQRAAAFSSRVRDVTEVLDAMPLGEPSRPIDARVTYQEPCHLVHAQRVSAAPRRLLQSIPGLRLIEMNESAVCCGSAGVYNLTQPEMASRLQRRKVENVTRTGATIVATANPGCAMQVAAGLHDAGYDARVAHIVELLDEAYG